jgi:hypothetical protein
MFLASVQELGRVRYGLLLFGAVLSPNTHATKLIPLIFPISPAPVRLTLTAKAAPCLPAYMCNIL